MNLLLDTHVLVWWITDDPALTESARKLIANRENQIYYSIVSLWETEIKRSVRSGGLGYSVEQIVSYCQDYDFPMLPLRVSHILGLRDLKRKAGTAPHKDPFDKIMLCQAMAEDMLFVTHDYKLAGYDTDCIRHV